MAHPSGQDKLTRKDSYDEETEEQFDPQVTPSLHFFSRNNSSSSLESWCSGMATPTTLGSMTPLRSRINTQDSAVTILATTSPEIQELCKQAGLVLSLRDENQFTHNDLPSLEVSENRVLTKSSDNQLSQSRDGHDENAQSRDGHDENDNRRPIITILKETRNLCKDIALTRLQAPPSCIDVFEENKENIPPRKMLHSGTKKLGLHRRISCHQLPSPAELEFEQNISSVVRERTILRCD